jgi:HAMP domain-containing protein
MSLHPDGKPSDNIPTDGQADEIGRLVGLVKRLEQENSSLRRELAANRPLPA